MTPTIHPQTEVSPSCREHVARPILDSVFERLAHVTVLTSRRAGTPAILYVALHLVLDPENEVITCASRSGLPLLPQVCPTQLAGIEINPYAQESRRAGVVVSIGLLQWKHHNGFTTPRNPALEPVETIRRIVPILDTSEPEHPKEHEWPELDTIVGNASVPAFTATRTCGIIAGVRP